MRQTLVLPNVTRSTKLRGAQRSPELGFQEHGLLFTRKPNFSNPECKHYSSANWILFLSILRSSKLDAETEGLYTLVWEQNRKSLLPYDNIVAIVLKNPFLDLENPKTTMVFRVSPTLLGLCTWTIQNGSQLRLHLNWSDNPLSHT